MENYPPTARARVAEMIAAAEAEPNRAVAFQGAPGAYSHQAVRALYDPAAALPCFSFADAIDSVGEGRAWRSEKHPSELQSLMRISYADFCLKKEKHTHEYHQIIYISIANT